ncbi:unnamed protein product [Lymnaea stagnalis]|uniref:Uncharacterized protein n=1 Tax=Lymnaea stagnalis TaxID=6523 RepID=A0AAV2HCW5_LYMST
MDTGQASMRILHIALYYLATISFVVGGQTCSFVQSSTNVAIFCENGCCSNECCTSDSVDTDAIAIGVSVALALLLLALLIILLVYCCCCKRNKGKWSDDESTSTDGTEAVMITSFPPRKHSRIVPLDRGYYDNTRYTQTGEPPNVAREKIFFGRSNRWNSMIKPRAYRNVRTFRSYPVVDKSCQTPGNAPTMIRPVAPPTTPYYNESASTSHYEKSAQTPAQNSGRAPAPGSRLYDANRVARDKNKKGYTSSWMPQVPWQPHKNENSLSKTRPKPLDTYANNGSLTLDQPYPVHRHSPEVGHYKYDVDQYGEHIGSSSSVTYVRPRTDSGFD